MMECKRALVEAQGDIEKGIEILRKRGAAALAKKAGRATGEGRIGCYIDESQGVGGIVELRCESAPVANSGEFVKLCEKLAEIVATGDVEPTADAVAAAGQQHIHDAANKLRENIQLARVGRLTGKRINSYVHHNGQIGVLLASEGETSEPQRSAELLNDLCMQIAAGSPAVAIALTREQVDEKLVEKEREIAAAQVQNKPPQIIDKIVTGKLNKWFSQCVLLEQPFVKDDKKAVKDVIAAAGGDLKLTGFLRFVVGEES